MPANHRIDNELKTVFVIAKGNIEIKELIENEKKILNNPEFEKGYNKYIDFSDAKPATTEDYDKIKMSAEFVKSTQHLRGKCKWSIFAPSEDAYIFSDLFSKLTKGLELETKVFNNENDAKKWLGI